MIRLFLIFILALQIPFAEGQGALRGDLTSACSTGNPKNIADLCLNHVRRELRKGKLSEERINSMLENQDFRLVFWMGRYFSSLKWKGTFVATELRDVEFTRWLLSNPDIFEKLVFANKPHAATLGIFYRIRAKEGANLPPPLLNLALGAALCADKFTPDECVARFDFYKKSFEKKALFPQFETLEPWEHVLLLSDTESVDGGIDTLAWGQSYIAEKKNITPENIGWRACGFTPYRDKNKEGVSVHSGRAFYDKKPMTLEIYTEYGGVCGAVSKAACGFLKSKGIPCYTVGQPGHCAFVWKSPNGDWWIGNDISGWNMSSGNPGLPWSGPTFIIRLLPQFMGEASTRSKLFFYLADYVDNKDLALWFCARAIKEDPNNYAAWKAWLAASTKQVSEVTKKKIASDIKGKIKESYIVYDLIYENIAFNWKQTDPYEICAMLLDSEESGDSSFMYMRQFKKLALAGITQLRELYSEDGKVGFFEAWEKCCKGKPPLKTKKQSCQVLQKAMAHVPGKVKTYGQFLELYSQFLQDWKDKALMSEADRFIRSQLAVEQHPTNKTELIRLGMILAELTGDKKASKFYVEASSDPIS